MDERVMPRHVWRERDSMGQRSETETIPLDRHHLALLHRERRVEGIETAEQRGLMSPPLDYQRRLSATSRPV